MTAVSFDVILQSSYCLNIQIIFMIAIESLTARDSQEASMARHVLKLWFLQLPLPDRL